MRGPDYDAVTSEQRDRDRTPARPVHSGECRGVFGEGLAS
jgi:hypothetical protein